MKTKISAKQLYEYKLEINSATEFGASMADVENGTLVMPKEGIRQDAYFKGEIWGDKINGRVDGIDYIYIRADGRFELNIFATIITHDGQNISLQSKGVTTPTDKAGILNIRQSIILTSHHEDYKWLNVLQIWGEGSVNMQEGVVRLRAFI